MRTTVDLDDDVVAAVRDRAQRERRSMGSVLSELARVALTASTPSPSGPGFYGFHPLPRRGGLVTNALIDELREDEPE